MFILLAYDLAISSYWSCKCDINKLRPRHNGRHFADVIFKCIFLNENVWIPIKISLKFVPKGPINYIPALVQIMAWRWPDDKPLSETMMVRLLMHICVTRPKWVNTSGLSKQGTNYQCFLCVWGDILHLTSYNLHLAHIKIICVYLVL